MVFIPVFMDKEKTTFIMIGMEFIVNSAYWYYCIKEGKM